jgi:hypothetical protein
MVSWNLRRFRRTAEGGLMFLLRFIQQAALLLQRHRGENRTIGGDREEQEASGG